MKNRLYVFFCFCVIGFTALISGCTSEVNLELKEDGKVEVQFKGSAGAAFTKMIQSATGSSDVIFETDEIKMELEKSGFTKVKVSSNKSDLMVSMTEPVARTFLSKSGLVQVQKKSIKAVIDRKNLSNFYNAADDQIVMVLDLLLAPVFNDEEMDVSEYLDTLASFYGAGISKEIAESVVKITVSSPDGKKDSKTIPLATLLCLTEAIQVGF